MVKKIGLGFLVFLLIAGVGGALYSQGLSDLRPAYTKAHGASKETKAKGRQLLMKALEKLGGYARWKQQRSKPVRIVFDDKWFGFLPKKLFMPLEFSGQKMSLLVQPDMENSRLTFLDGKRKGSAWGLQQWRTYKADSAGKITWKQDSKIKFFLPTYQYFFFMPFYLADAQLLVYAGERKHKGKTYDLVFASWGKLKPQKKVDQYLIWIERKTLRIDYVQFTIREILNRALGTVYLTDYRDVRGLKIPHVVNVLKSIKSTKESAHTMTLQSIKLAKKDVSKFLVPDPSKKASK